MKHGILLPEWSPVAAVMMAWPPPNGDWRETYAQVEQCYWSLLQAISQVTEVWLLIHESIDLGGFERELEKRSLPAANIQLFPSNYNDTWIRDFAPLSTDSGYVKFEFNGWGGKYAAELDNLVTLAVMRQQSQDVQRVDLICEGGALETNGQQLLMNANCVIDESRNPAMTVEQVSHCLRETLGLTELVWLQDICLTGDDTDGHIDTIARFATPNTLLYSGPNPEHPDAETLDSLQRQVDVISQRYGWHSKALPSPVYRSVVDHRILPCTYANFLICNEVVFAPVYGLAEDEVALACLREAFAGYQVVPVRCEALLEQHGSLHCATMQIAKR